MILTSISQRELSGVEKILRAYWQDHQKKNVFRPMIGAMEKIGKYNRDAYWDRDGEKFVIRRFLDKKHAI